MELVATTGVGELPPELRAVLLQATRRMSRRTKRAFVEQVRALADAFPDASGVSAAMRRDLLAGAALLEEQLAAGRSLR